MNDTRPDPDQPRAPQPQDETQPVRAQSDAWSPPTAALPVDAEPGAGGAADATDAIDATAAAAAPAGAARPRRSVAERWRTGSRPARIGAGAAGAALLVLVLGGTGFALGRATGGDGPARDGVGRHGGAFADRDGDGDGGRMGRMGGEGQPGQVPGQLGQMPGQPGQLGQVPGGPGGPGDRDGDGPGLPGQTQPGQTQPSTGASPSVNS